MNVLVTGGAGYIGSVVAEGLIKNGYRVVVVDNLQQGHREAVPAEAEFVLADIQDMEMMGTILERNKIGAVVHLAAESQVAQSMTDPGKYFRSNICHGLNLLDAMVRHDVRKLIFSSSASVYGEPASIPIKEDHPQNPVNSYGESKLLFERILPWYEKTFGLKAISLRYFNAAGATDKRGEDHRPETHLIPIVLKAALGMNRSVDVFGTDYPTRDGSCIRDYVHVVDIAQAHTLALKKADKSSGTVAYNLGNGEGYSVLDVVATARKVTGIDIPVSYSPRRAGDPAILVASSSRAKAELGWKPAFPDLESIIGSAWEWMKGHPDGYSR